MTKFEVDSKGSVDIFKSVKTKLRNTPGVKEHKKRLTSSPRALTVRMTSPKICENKSKIHLAKEILKG